MWAAWASPRGRRVWRSEDHGATWSEADHGLPEVPVGAVVPELVSWKWQVNERGGRARLDYTQNAINKTLVAPYSPRAMPGATVSAPIEWDELDDPELRPDGFTIRTILDRVAERGDPFRTVLNADQTLPPLD